jgi:hypothetical protein
MAVGTASVWRNIKQRRFNHRQPLHDQRRLNPLRLASYRNNAIITGETQTEARAYRTFLASSTL